MLGWFKSLELQAERWQSIEPKLLKICFDCISSECLMEQDAMMIITAEGMRAVFIYTE